MKKTESTLLDGEVLENAFLPADISGKHNLWSYLWEKQDTEG